MSEWEAAWRLDDGAATLIVAQSGTGLPEPVYLGPSLPPGAPLPIANTLALGLTNGTLDAVAPLSLCPEEARGHFGAPGLEACAADGTRWLTAFVTETVTATPTHLTISAGDTVAGLSLAIEIGIQDGVLRASGALTNTHSNQAVLLLRVMAPTLPLPTHADRLRTFGGRWAGEFKTHDVPIGLGRIVREARQGRTSHEHFPAAIALSPGTTEAAGRALGFHLAWSGGHTMTAEELADGRRFIQFGALVRPGEIILKPGECYTTPDLLVAVSTDGLSGISQRYQHSIRSALGTQSRPRPVTYNSWEAVYFDQSFEKLSALASDAATLGVERFVLDDGWFQGRNDDTTSLGDWEIDHAKWPDGLAPLIDHVRALGMEFGIWLEPEMLNTASIRAREHPGWVLQDERYPPPFSRHQMVRDLTQPASFDDVFARIDAVLSAHPISYVKWDHNRPLVAAAGMDGRAATLKQTEAFLSLLQKLSARHPSVEFESCSGGGGRIDAGVLRQAGRVWLSDSNDAVERMAMQHTAALFLPPEVVGSHVGPRHCHTSGRTLSMATRAWTAAARHMGFEFDLAELTEPERDTLKRVVDWHKRHRDLLHNGTPWRLDMTEPGATGEVTMQPDGQRFVAFLSFPNAPQRYSAAPVRLAGLATDATYTVRLANPEFIDPRATKVLPKIARTPVKLSGGALMTSGLALPIHNPGTVWVLEGAAE